MYPERVSSESVSLDHTGGSSVYFWMISVLIVVQLPSLANKPTNVETLWIIALMYF